MRGRGSRAGVLAVILAAAILVPGVASAGGVTAADAEYTASTPLVKPRPVQPRTTPSAQRSQPDVQGAGSGPLPFTGLSLAAPVVFSLLLLGAGVGLRHRVGRRRQ